MADVVQLHSLETFNQCGQLIKTKGCNLFALSLGMLPPKSPLGSVRCLQSGLGARYAVSSSHLCVYVVHTRRCGGRSAAPTTVLCRAQKTRAIRVGWFRVPRNQGKSCPDARFADMLWSWGWVAVLGAGDARHGQELALVRQLVMCRVTLLTQPLVFCICVWLSADRRDTPRGSGCCFVVLVRRSSTGG